jgi:hypothetical protein
MISDFIIMISIKADNFKCMKDKIRKRKQLSFARKIEITNFIYIFFINALKKIIII